MHDGGTNPLGTGTSATLGAAPLSESPTMFPVTVRLAHPARLALVLGLLGLGWRIVLTVLGVPPTNSDEAIMGLAALHVAQGNGVPTYFYGQHYMGTIEALLAAPLVAVFGPSVIALRVVTLVLYAAMLVLVFHLVRRVFSPGLAVFTVGLLALGGDRLVLNQLQAIGGYPESVPMVAGLLLLTYGLVTRRLTQWWAYAGWGLLFGLIVWNHWSPAPYLLGALVVLLAFRVLTWRTAAVTFGALLVGALPLLIDNVRAEAADRSINVFLALNAAGPAAPLSARIMHGGFSGLPGALGLCEVDRCAGWTQVWAPVIVALLIVATVAAIRGLRDTDRPERAKHSIRLVLAAAALVSLATYLNSPAAGGDPMGTSRYLAMLVLSVPAAIWPVWEVAGRWTARALIPAVALGTALALTMAFATVSLVRHIPRYQAVAARQSALIAALDSAGLTRIHTDYWTCYWITYTTGERIVCGVLSDDAGKGHNRYPPHWRDEAQAVVASIGSPLAAVLAERGVRSEPPLEPMMTVAGYVIYGALRRAP